MKVALFGKQLDERDLVDTAHESYNPEWDLLRTSLKGENRTFSQRCRGGWCICY